MAKKSQEIVEKNEDLPAEFLEQITADAGQGVSLSQEDTLIPFLGIAQSGSPQLKRQNSEYIDGLKEGDILLPSLGRFWDGEKGILFVPAFFSRDVAEWIPRDQGGGRVGTHPEMPKDAERVSDPQNPQRQRWVSPRGTEYIDTRYHFGIVLNGEEAQGGPPMGPMQVVMSLSSTGHSFSRQWMTQMSQIKLPGGKVAPSRSRIWRLTTVGKSNNAGQWSVFRAEDEGWLRNKDIYDAATAMYTALQEGRLRAGEASQHDQEDKEIPF